MAERPGLDAVVFDAGGTLVRLDFEWMSECLASLGVNVVAETLRRGEIEGRRRYDASRGTAPAPGAPPPPLGVRGDTLAYFRGMLSAAGVPEHLQAQALERFEAHHRDGGGIWSRPMEGARATVDRLAATSLRLAVVSNSDGRAERHLIDCDVREGLAFVVDSHLVGVEKPDPAIFRIALDRLGVEAARALYVGDIRCVDEAGARAAGMQFVIIDPYGDYASGAPAIRGIADLPEWLFANFAVAGPAPAGAADGTSG